MGTGICAGEVDSPWRGHHREGLQRLIQGYQGRIPFHVYQAKVDLVHQSRRLERVLSADRGSAIAIPQKKVSRPWPVFRSTSARSGGGGIGNEAYKRGCQPGNGRNAGS
jgi:hypothetical protein